jgi:tRNA nucleotidyltransferase (CCA-adding enzyme)
MMNMENEIKTLTKQVLKKITPTKKERVLVSTICHEIEQKLTLACQQEGISAIVRVEGSVAKDTWLSENPDIDIFVRLPTSIPRKKLGEVGLKIAKKAAGSAEQIERFAEHPYLQIRLCGYRVDIVPCYNTLPGDWQSATDRTPHHTNYIKTSLNKNLRCEVRLLKRFMQGIGVYGAEIKVGGFSGYLCELLILKYDSFYETLLFFSNYSRRVLVDINNFYSGREKELLLLFPEPLVIIDPVDRTRNVASAVLPQKLYEFIGAIRAFLKKPSAYFFYPPKRKSLSIVNLKRYLCKRDSSIVFLIVGKLDAVPDVLWGQLYKSKRSLHTLLLLNDFKVLKDAVWSNEKTLSLFMFKLEQKTIPNIKKHLGPPLELKAECEKYLSKYIDNNLVISGPYIEDNRWMVELPRKTIDAVTLLKEKLTDGGKKVGVPDLIAEEIKKKIKILVNDAVLEVYSQNKDFAAFLTDFLSGKTFWLKE